MEKSNNTITLIGAGNVATHLGKALVSQGVSVSHLWSRTEKNAAQLAQEINASVSTLEDLPKNQLTLVCVSDDAVSEVLSRLDPSIPVAYTSGSVGLMQLPQRQNMGVFYPLQTFSAQSEVTMGEVPFLIEANNAAFEKFLVSLATKLSPHVHLIDSDQRKHLHHAAVWVNNFTNHIIYQAQQIAAKNKLDFALLQPLLRETIRKVELQSAKEAQTGPARRNDQQTIARQLATLEDTSKELYALLTKSITETYRNDQL